MQLAVGVIEELGQGVIGFEGRDMVGFMPASNTCQSCDECISGQHRFCGKRTNVGFDGNYGGFSEYCIADPLSTVKLPEGLSDEVAAPMFCAGVTAYGAIKKAVKIQLGGSLINIIECGVVGHLAIMYAKAMEFRVTAFDIADDKIKLALDNGAEKALNSLTIKDEEMVKAPSTIVIRDTKQAYELAFKTTLFHGGLVAVGVPHGHVPVDTTNQDTKSELQAALQLAADFNFKPVFEKKSMEDISEGYKDLLKVKVVGRYVYSWH